MPKHDSQIRVRWHVPMPESPLYTWYIAESGVEHKNQSINQPMPDWRRLALVLR